MTAHEVTGEAASGASGADSSGDATAASRCWSATARAPARTRRRRPRIAAARGSAELRRRSAPADVTVLAKPPVRKLARDLGVDLRTVRGSGPAGSITREDVGAVARWPDLRWARNAGVSARRCRASGSRCTACARRWLRR